MCGTIFGGGLEAVIDIATCVEKELAERTQEGWINNEQILLAYLFRANGGDGFHLVYNNTPSPFVYLVTCSYIVGILKPYKPFKKHRPY